MNLKLILSVLCIVAILFSCKKSGKTEEPNQKEPGKKVLSKITMVTPNQIGNTASFTNFTYDSNGNLISEKSSSVESRYFYKLGELYQVISETQYGRITCDFEYEAGKVKKVSVNDESIDKKKYDLICTYQGERLIHVDQVRDNLVWIKIDYSYEGENDVKVTIDDFKITFVREFTFSDKKHPHHAMGFAAIQAIEFSKSFSPTFRLPTKQRQTTHRDGVIIASEPITNTNFTYTFDDDRYPLTAIRVTTVSVSPSPIENRFTYEYKTLE